MDRKFTAIALAAVFAVSVAGAGVVVADQGATQAAGNETATITTTGTGEASAQPDTARVTVAVTATADSAANATDRLSENATQLREAFGDDDRVESLRTTGFQVYQTERNGSTVYQAQQSFELTVPNTSDAGGVVDAAVDNGATEVYGVAFTLSEERRQELRSEAIDAAVSDAESQAQAAASSTGLSLAGEQSVTVERGGFGPVAEADAGGGGTVIDPGPVSVSTSVTVTYNATGS